VFRCIASSVSLICRSRHRLASLRQPTAPAPERRNTRHRCPGKQPTNSRKLTAKTQPRHGRDPGGTYMMGKRRPQKGREQRGAPNPVTLKPFRDGEIETTWDITISSAADRTRRSALRCKPAPCRRHRADADLRRFRPTTIRTTAPALCMTHHAARSSAAAGVQDEEGLTPGRASGNGLAEPGRHRVPGRRCQQARRLRRGTATMRGTIRTRSAPRRRTHGASTNARQSLGVVPSIPTKKTYSNIRSIGRTLEPFRRADGEATSELARGGLGRRRREGPQRRLASIRYRLRFARTRKRRRACGGAHRRRHVGLRVICTVEEFEGLKGKKKSARKSRSRATTLT